MIVITGATGNVGRVLVKTLAAAGEPVTAVSRGALPVSVPDGVRHQLDFDAHLRRRRESSGITSR